MHDLVVNTRPLHPAYPARAVIMAAVGGNTNVTELLQKLHLTAEEEVVADFSDNDLDAGEITPEWVLVGKVLSPVPLHVSMIQLGQRWITSSPSSVVWWTEIGL